MPSISYQAYYMRAKQKRGICRLCSRHALSTVLLCAHHNHLERKRRCAKYHARKDRGVCVEPKCNRPPVSGRVRCAPCLAAIAQYQRVWRNHRDTKKRKRKKLTRKPRAKNVHVEQNGGTS